MSGLDDVIVVGGGPAAWAAARACAQRGLGVRLITPDPDRSWPATYGLWVDRLDGLGLGAPWARTWSAATVRTERVHRLGVAYGRVDNGCLRRALEHESVAVVAGEVAGVSRGERHPAVLLRDGTAARARLVVVAAGSGSPLVGDRRPRSVQVAWGATIPCEAAPDVDPAGCTFMDWSAPRNDPFPGAPPSFLYAQGLGNGQVFVEETVLATTRTDLAVELLQRRLAARGIDLRDVADVEHVRIPLGRGPVMPADLVAFGAAGGFVHPATGYSLARSLRAAPVLADAAADALGRGISGRELVAHVHEALWPAPQRRVDALVRYGGAVVCRLGRVRLAALFDALFDLPVEQWRGYVDHDAGPRSVATAMTRVFAAGDAGLRTALASGGWFSAGGG